MKQVGITEKELTDTLEDNDCNVPQTAKELGVTRAGVYWLLKKYHWGITKRKCLTRIK